MFSPIGEIPCDSGTENQRPEQKLGQAAPRRDTICSYIVADAGILKGLALAGARLLFAETLPQSFVKNLSLVDGDLPFARAKVVADHLLRFGVSRSANIAVGWHKTSQKPLPNPMAHRPYHYRDIALTLIRVKDPLDGVQQRAARKICEHLLQERRDYAAVSSEPLSKESKPTDREDYHAIMAHYTALLLASFALSTFVPVTVEGYIEFPKKGASNVSLLAITNIDLLPSEHLASEEDVKIERRIASSKRKKKPQRPIPPVPVMTEKKQKRESDSDGEDEHMEKKEKKKKKSKRNVVMTEKKQKKRDSDSDGEDDEVEKKKKKRNVINATIRRPAMDMDDSDSDHELANRKDSIDREVSAPPVVEEKEPKTRHICKRPFRVICQHAHTKVAWHHPAHNKSAYTGVPGLSFSFERPSDADELSIILIQCPACTDQPRLFPAKDPDAYLTHWMKDHRDYSIGGQGTDQCLHHCFVVTCSTCKAVHYPFAEGFQKLRAHRCEAKEDLCEDCLTRRVPDNPAEWKQSPRFVPSHSRVDGSRAGCFYLRQCAYLLGQETIYSGTTLFDSSSPLSSLAGEESKKPVELALSSLCKRVIVTMLRKFMIRAGEDPGKVSRFYPWGSKANLFDLVADLKSPADPRIAASPSVCFCLHEEGERFNCQTYSLVGDIPLYRICVSFGDVVKWFLNAPLSLSGTAGLVACGVGPIVYEKVNSLGACFLSRALQFNIPLEASVTAYDFSAVDLLGVESEVRAVPMSRDVGSALEAISCGGVTNANSL